MDINDEELNTDLKLNTELDSEVKIQRHHMEFRKSYFREVEAFLDKGLPIPKTADMEEYRLYCLILDHKRENIDLATFFESYYERFVLYDSILKEEDYASFMSYFQRVFK